MSRWQREVRGRRQVKARPWIVGTLGLFVVLLSVWQIRTAAHGLDITRLPGVVPPVTIVAPAGAVPGSRPLVLIGHGFAGSGLVMRGFAFSLAHAGYAAVLLDFDGHGANPRSLRAEPLIGNARAALAEATARGLVAPGRVAILGHSMGSGVALQFGQAYPDTAATIAVSPVTQPVTPSLPRNLLLLAGSLEAPFRRNAERRLAEAGGPGGSPADGTARKLVVVPGVEHASILFAHATHSAVIDWLDATFGPQPGARAYTDRRMAWYGLGIVGTLLLASAVALSIAEPASLYTPWQGPVRPLWWRVGALAGGALGASLFLWLAGAGGLELPGLLGLLVGGYLFAWFGLAGALALLLLWTPPFPPSRRAVLGGLIAFAALWLGVGLLGQYVWYPWLLIWHRLRLWPLGVLLSLPWFLAAGRVVGGPGIAGQLGRWLVQSAVLLGGLYLAVSLSPGLEFLGLILPAFPGVIGLHALAAAPHRNNWSFALSGALFTSWAFLAMFPLQ